MMSTQKIILIGYTETNIAALESSYARAFKAAGYKINRWDPLEAIAKVVRLSKLGQLLSRFIHIEPWVRKANENLLLFSERVQPDLILIIGTSGIRAGTLAQLRVRHPKCRIYCIYPDSPHNLDLERISCFPFFDRFMTSSPAWVTAFQKLGATNVHYLPFAADTTLHNPVPKTTSISNYQADLAFIGTWRPEREELLEGLSDFELKIWGSNYWEQRVRRDSPLIKKWTGKPVIGQEFAQVCADSKVLLNIMDTVTWPGPNMRVFEQPACRAFSLVTRSSAVLDLFEEDKTIVCFDSVEEARSKIHYYLTNDEARTRIAEASYQFIVGGGHTYADRVQQIIQWFQEDAKRT